MKRFFQLLEFVLKAVNLRGHVKPGFEFIEPFFRARKTRARDARQLVVLLSEDFGLRVELFREDCSKRSSVS